MSRFIAVLLVLVACTREVPARFLGATPSFLEVGLHSGPVLKVDPHRSYEPHDEHGHDKHDEHAHDKHDEHGHDKHDEHGHDKHDEHSHGHAHEDAHHTEHGDHGHASVIVGADAVAVGLMAWVILQPLVIYMTLTKAAGGQISFLTLRMIDMSISIFLAVLWFSASGDVLKSDALHNLFPHAKEVFAIVQVLSLYLLTLVVANAFRQNKYYLLAFCGCAGHYIAFAGIKAAGDCQRMAAQLVGHDARPYMSLAFCAVVLGICIALSVVCFWAWRRHVDPKSELHFAIDELELDVIGLVLSFAIMQAVRHILTGHYPAAHLFLQTSLLRDYDEGHGHSHHTATQRLQMLACAIVFTILAILSLKYLEAVKERVHYWMHKFLHVVQVVLVMCAAWGYLLWGQWQFYETTFQGDKMFGNMVFAVLVTVIALVIIISLAFADEQFSNAKAYGNLCIMAVSLVTAWSWEHCFHVAIDVITQQHEAEYGALLPKIVIALLVPIIILPGYLAYVKPVLVEKEESLCADEIAEYEKDISEITSPSKILDMSEVASPQAPKTDESW